MYTYVVIVFVWHQVEELYLKQNKLELYVTKLDQRNIWY